MKNNSIQTFMYGICMLLSGLSMAQHQAVIEVFDKVEAAYASEEGYHIEMTYAMYRGLTGNTITESYTGTMIKKGDFTSFSILNSALLQFGSVQLTIDHDTKKMQYEHTSSGILKSSPLKISKFLENFKESVVYEKNGDLYCELITANQQHLNTQFPYGKIVLQIHKNTYKIKQQEFFFSTQLPFAVNESRNKELDFGRLIIRFRDKAMDTVILPKLEDYILVSSTQSPTVAPQYHQYTLHHEE